VELRSQLAARDEVYRETQATLDRELERARDLEQDVSTRADELSRANSELKDLRIELDVLQSGEGMTATQVQRLQKERDALVVLANRLKQALLQAQRAAGAQPVVAEPTR
jgi:chromosome segregation ATPase